MDAVPLNDLARPVTAQLWLLRKYPMLSFERTLNPDPTTLAPTPIPVARVDRSRQPELHALVRAPARTWGPNERCKEPQVAPGRAGAAVRGRLPVRRPARLRVDRQPVDHRGLGRLALGDRAQAARRRRAHHLLGSAPAARSRHHRSGAGHPAGRLHDHARPSSPTGPPTSATRYRVTTNQALIVGAGAQLRRSRHHRAGQRDQLGRPCTSSPGTACFGCHQTLDPMRDFFRQSYSLSYFQQFDLATRPGHRHLHRRRQPAGDGHRDRRPRPGHRRAPALRRGLDPEAVRVRQLVPLPGGRPRVPAGGRRRSPAAGSSGSGWCASCSPVAAGDVPPGRPAAPRPPAGPSASSAGSRCARRWRTAWACPTCAT